MLNETKCWSNPLNSHDKPPKRHKTNSTGDVEGRSPLVSNYQHRWLCPQLEAVERCGHAHVASTNFTPMCVAVYLSSPCFVSDGACEACLVRVVCISCILCTVCLGGRACDLVFVGVAALVFVSVNWFSACVRVLLRVCVSG